MRCRGQSLASLLLAAVAVSLLLAPSAKALDPGNQSPDPRQIADLVRQLGAESYPIRERATRTLTEMGIVTQPALTAALKDPDAEIRNRAAGILAIVTEADFLARLDAFAADLDGEHAHNLPGWDVFRSAVGEDRTARSLFVEMQRAEPKLMAGLAAGNRAASTAFAQRCGALQQTMQLAMRVDVQQQTMPLGAIAALLFVGSRDGVDVEEQAGGQLYQFIYQTNFESMLRSGELAVPLRKILGLWIVKDNGPMIAQQNLMVAHLFNMKAEGLTLALRILAKGGGQSQIRQIAILLVGNFGNRQNVADLQPLLKDTTRCAFQPTNGVGAHLQIRDVALAMCLHLTGQNPKAYGFSATLNPSPLFQAGPIAFSDEARRTAAFRKWDEWVAAQAPKP